MERILKKNGHLQERYVWEFSRLAQNSNHKKHRVYGKKWLRSRGKHTLVTSEYDRTLDIVQALGIPFCFGNDAPRGGIEGDYIDITLDGRNKSVKLLRSLASEDIRNINFKALV